MKKIKLAIVGVGNCASSLIQGISYYCNPKEEAVDGLMHLNIVGYQPSDIEVVAAFDIDKRKVGLPLFEAIFKPPNNTVIFCKEFRNTPIIVQMGSVLDDVS
ncbi:MAG: hypothetical protein ACXU9U_01495 [Parachlamydiaceae bacterium]